MLKSPHIKFRKLLYNRFKIESSELKKCMKFPVGAVYTDMTQNFTKEKCNFIAQISLS